MSLKHATRRIIHHSHALNAALESAHAVNASNIDRIRRTAAQELKLAYRGNTCRWDKRLSFQPTARPSQFTNRLADILQTVTVAILYVDRTAE